MYKRYRIGVNPKLVKTLQHALAVMLRIDQGSPRHGQRQVVGRQLQPHGGGGDGQRELMGALGGDAASNFVPLPGGVEDDRRQIRPKRARSQPPR